jgi:hypothetical protein
VVAAFIDTPIPAQTGLPGFLLYGFWFSLFPKNTSYKRKGKLHEKIHLSSIGDEKFDPNHKLASQDKKPGENNKVLPNKTLYYLLKP